jgi:hypothetical protein
MKKLVTLALAGICALAFASVADAGTAVRQKTIVNVTSQQGKVVQHSSVYANTATATANRGQSGAMTYAYIEDYAMWVFNYLYSSDITNSETVLAALRDKLNNPYKNLVPSIVGESEATGLAVLSVTQGAYGHSSWDSYATLAAQQAKEGNMNANWTSASYVAQNVVPGRNAGVQANQDTTGAAVDPTAVFDDEGVELVDETGNDIQAQTTHAYGKLSTSVTDNVTYTVIDGELVKVIDRAIDYTLEDIAIYSRSANKRVSPLVLDMTGNGVLQASNGQHMPGHPVVNKNVILSDFYGDGFEVAMEWVGPQDGLLVAPKADGSVDMSCLFGTAGGYETGYEKLSLYDTNRDNKVSGEELNGLSVWQDANSNGIADAGEVKTAQELGISEISLTADNQFVSSFTMNGNTNKMWDWWPNAVELIKVAGK